MSTFAFTLLAFAIVMIVMSIGVLLGRPPLKGSCGGKSGPECACNAFERAKCKVKEQLSGSGS